MYAKSVAEVGVVVVRSVVYYGVRIPCFKKTISRMYETMRFRYEMRFAVRYVNFMLVS